MSFIRRLNGLCMLFIRRLNGLCMLFIRRLFYDRILLVVSCVDAIDSIATAGVDGS